MPRLMPENEIPALIFFKCKNQHIMGFNGPVDLDHQAIFKWMEIYNVPKEKHEETFEIIYAAYQNYYKAIMKKD
jgi:hypothetical protein